MDELITEKATSRLDLPHPYKVREPLVSQGIPAEVACECGRREGSDLHASTTTRVAEHASAGTRIQTEKGTL